jgi:capsular exopolysaccharide synthesis family protein
MDNDCGLTEALTGIKLVEDLIRPTGIDSLFCLTAGSKAPNPSELLGSSKMKELLEELSEVFDRIVIDSAPILPVTDSIILSRIVDGVMLVVGPKTPRQLVRKVSTQLLRAGAKVLGVILNRIDLRVPGYYGYGNGAYTYGSPYYLEDRVA